MKLDSAVGIVSVIAAVSGIAFIVWQIEVAKNTVATPPPAGQPTTSLPTAVKAAFTAPFRPTVQFPAASQGAVVPAPKTTVSGRRMPFRV